VSLWRNYNKGFCETILVDSVPIPYSKLHTYVAVNYVKNSLEYGNNGLRSIIRALINSCFPHFYFAKYRIVGQNVAISYIF